MQRQPLYNRSDGPMTGNVSVSTSRDTSREHSNANAAIAIQTIKTNAGFLVQLSSPRPLPRSFVDVHSTNLPIRLAQLVGSALNVFIARWVDVGLVLTIHVVSIPGHRSTKCRVQDQTHIPKVRRRTICALT
jgi:hypothetical protein